MLIIIFRPLLKKYLKKKKSKPKTLKWYTGKMYFNTKGHCNGEAEKQKT